MARKGRNRKPGPREASGRPQRPSVADLDEMNRTERLKPMAVVLAQPHRLGSTDQLCASAVGRFILYHRLAREIYDAANDYLELVVRWRVAKGIPVRIRMHAGTGDGASSETVAGWTQQIARIELGIGQITKSGCVAMRRLILDDEDIIGQYEHETITALYQLAREYGRIDRSHPFLAA